jgi:hypothetical protein
LWLQVAVVQPTVDFEPRLLGLLALLELLTTPGRGDEPALLQPLTLPSWLPKTPAGRQQVLRRYEQAQRRLAQKRLPYDLKKKLSKKDKKALKNMKVSLSDPEAALGWDKVGTFRPLYNVLLLQATDAPLTLSWDVQARNNDDGLLRPMLERSRAHLEQPLEEVLVDGGFVSVADLVYCEEHGVTVYAPVGQPQALAATTEQADQQATQQASSAGEGGKAKKGKKLAKSVFRYSGEEKVYYCPEGKRLAEAYRSTEQRSSGVELPVIVHRASGEDCQKCPRQPGCTSNPARGRVVKRYEGEESLERLQQRMQEPASRAIYKLRCQSVELGYANIKEHHGLRVFRSFGMKRARAQVGLIVLASNGLRISRILQRRHNNQPSPEPLQPTG